MRGLILGLAVGLAVLLTAGEGRADDEEDSSDGQPYLECPHRVVEFDC